LAVSNEINGLAAIPAILPFFKPARQNCRESKAHPANAERSAAAADAEALADLRL
jgi:hypothetical protein